MIAAESDTPKFVTRTVFLLSSFYRLLDFIHYWNSIVSNYDWLNILRPQRYKQKGEKMLCFGSELCITHIAELWRDATLLLSGFGLRIRQSSSFRYELCEPSGEQRRARALTHTHKYVYCQCHVEVIPRTCYCSMK